jgi:hypothetical protein
MNAAEYLILAAGAFAAGLALGPIYGRRARQMTAVWGIIAALTAAALTWPMGRGILVDTVAYDLLGLGMLGVDFVVAGLFGIAAVLVPLSFGAAVTGH